MRSMTSAAWTTSSSRQPLALPTSMYSMNRRIRPSALAHGAYADVALDGGAAGGLGGGDPLEDAGDGDVHAVHPPERLVVERVQRDRDPLQARLGERPGEGSQGRAVRREGQIGRLALGSPD